MSTTTPLLSTVCGWTSIKPATAGTYYVRGFRRGEPDSRPALVEVVLADGKCCGRSR